ncbi:MAG: hypothetical protein GMKNLPBB_02041 [Myxococcota bacterium]|nr:hypothetical protein [Myxococcota bacterium]
MALVRRMADDALHQRKVSWKDHAARDTLHRFLGARTPALAEQTPEKVVAMMDDAWPLLFDARDPGKVVLHAIAGRRGSAVRVFLFDGEGESGGSLNLIFQFVSGPEGPLLVDTTLFDYTRQAMFQSPAQRLAYRMMTIQSMGATPSSFSAPAFR